MLTTMPHEPYIYLCVFDFRVEIVRNDFRRVKLILICLVIFKLIMFFRI